MTYQYFEEKPFVLQIEFQGDWFTSDWFTTVADALVVAKMKVTKWRIIRHRTGATVASGTPVWVTTAAPEGEIGVLEWNWWLCHASIMELEAYACFVESVIAACVVICDEVDGDLREKVEARLLFYDTQLSDVQIQIQKRLQPQYVPCCEN